MIRVALDRTKCDGIFACLVHDDRFVEADDGLATIDPDADGVVDVDERDDRVIATVDAHEPDADLAASACPPGAITVTEVER